MNRPQRRRTPLSSNVLDFPVPTADCLEPTPAQESTPRQITRDNISQLLDTAQLEVNPGDGVWRTMVRADGEWNLTGLHRNEHLAISFKFKDGGHWYYAAYRLRIYDKHFDDSGVLNRPDIRINTAIDGPACHRSAREIKEIVADLMKDASLYSVLNAVESVCIDNAWPTNSNQPLDGERFDAWIGARWELGKLLDKPIVAKVSRGDIADPRRVREEKLIARLQAKAQRHLPLVEALIENPDRPQASFVERFRVHPITVRRYRRELEAEGAIPVLEHRHGPARRMQLTEAAD